VLRQDGLPALLVELGLEVLEEVGVVLALAEVGGGGSGVVLAQLIDNVAARRLGLNLVVDVAIVGFLQELGTAPGSVQGKEMVGNLLDQAAPRVSVWGRRDGQMGL
jgi:hypothetical protein